MIGKWIDRAALTALGAAGFYLFFLNAGSAIPLASPTIIAVVALV